MTAPLSTPDEIKASSVTSASGRSKNTAITTSAGGSILVVLPAGSIKLSR